jgi:acyl dehydratase
MRFAGIDDLPAHEALGALGASDWHEVSQDRIDRFAEVTGDRQWIHVDPERARREGPFGGTIALGTGARIVVRTRAEIDGESKPACVADQVLALY